MTPGRWVCAAAVSFASLATTGCGYTETHEVLLRQPQPPRARHVEVYLAGQPVRRPFYEIALLQAVGHGTDASADDVGDALAQRAVALGCDAIVRVRIDQGYSMTNAVGVCARWAGPAGVSRPVAAPPPAAPRAAPPVAAPPVAAPPSAPPPLPPPGAAPAPKPSAAPPAPPPAEPPPSNDETTL